MIFVFRKTMFTMRLLQILGLAGCAVAQFSFPGKASSLELNKQIEIKWKAAGLEGPIAITLVPAGLVGQSVVAQQIAVGIQNSGLITWTPDLSITAFPGFNMVIIDAKAKAVVSEEFIIPGLVQKPGTVTRMVPVVTSKVVTDGSGVVATNLVTSVGSTLLPLPTGPIKLHMSGTQVLDKLVSGVNGAAPTPTEEINKDGQKEGLLPLPGADGNAQQPLGELKPLPNVVLNSTTATNTTTSAAVSTQTQENNNNNNGNNNNNNNKNGNGMNGGNRGNNKKQGNRNKNKNSNKGNNNNDNNNNNNNNRNQQDGKSKGAKSESNNGKNSNKDKSNSMMALLKRSLGISGLQLEDPSAKNVVSSPIQAQIEARGEPQATQADIRITLTPASPSDPARVIVVPGGKGNNNNNQQTPRGPGVSFTLPADATRTITTAIVPSGATNRAGTDNTPGGGRQGSKGDGNSESTEMGLAVKVGPGNILGVVAVVVGVLML